MPLFMLCKSKKKKELSIFAIVTLNETLAQSTANLKAPIVINTTNNKAKQVILNDEAYAIRQPLSSLGIKGWTNACINAKSWWNHLIDEDVEIIISEVKGEQVKLLLMHQEVLKLSAVNLDKIFPLQIQKQQKAI